MADNNLLHTAEIMRAASPYVDTRTKTTMDFIVKLLDLMGSFRTFVVKTDLAACGYENQKMNLEGLLSGIRPHCKGRELEFVDQILNIFNARRMYETYNTYMTAMKAMQGFDGFPFGEASEKDNDTTSGSTSGFDFKAFFNSLSPDESIHGSENTENTEPDINIAQTAPEDVTDAKVDPQEKNTAAQEDSPDSKESSDNTDSTDNTNNGSNNNNMLNMLKSMIPPEQMSTFENLSMLFNTMSYDGNRKSDDM